VPWLRLPGRRPCRSRRRRPGGFWGYRGLSRVLAIRQVTPDIGIVAGRIARRWHRAKGLIRQVTVQRVEQATGRVTYRRSAVRRKLFRYARGFVCVNDGAAFASNLGRYLQSLENRQCFREQFGKRTHRVIAVAAWEGSRSGCRVQAEAGRRRALPRAAAVQAVRRFVPSWTRVTGSSVRASDTRTAYAGSICSVISSTVSQPT
jgi:hypothetical protein